MPSEPTAPPADRSGPPEASGVLARYRTALRRTPASVWNDDVSDWAAALTYYAILALVPALLVTVTLIGIANPDATESLIRDIASVAPAESGAALRDTLEHAVQGTSAVWILLVTGTVSSLWSASSYLAVFRRAMHAMHAVRDVRPALRKAHIIVMTAICLLLLLMTSAVALVVTGPMARGLGRRLGMGPAGEAVWSALKWPLLVCLVAMLIMILFHSGPRVAKGVRRSLPGGVFAAFLWMTASAGFAFYATNIASYSRLYGSLAGVVVFLVWVWFANLSLLAGAQFNVELRRLAGRGPERPHPRAARTRPVTESPRPEGS
ncbi:YihY/virulence factor BrkB family protein [Streptomyces sp. CA-294286]|uniref:YihY/virulence factor BrkB family protein n=1 Tax=Streptomyces sp. CA-294286 TaxID=3240070 RepID=UPI003D8A126A